MRLRWLWMQAFGDDASSTKAGETVVVRSQPHRAVVVADDQSQVGAAFRSCTLWLGSRTMTEPDATTTRF